MAPEPFPALADAVAKYQGDQYSQLKRWQDGYSDCSSIIGKALKDLGITPPGASTTVDYAAWNRLVEIPRSEVTKGDILNKGGVHVVVALDNVNAIGQQRPGRNVQIGKIDGNLMFGATPYKCLRYIGPRPGKDQLLKAGFSLPDITPWDGVLPGSPSDWIIGPGGKWIAGKGKDAIGEGLENVYEGTLGKLIEFLMTPNDSGVSPGLRIVMFIGGTGLVAFALWSLLRGTVAAQAGAVLGAKTGGAVKGAVAARTVAKPGAQEVLARGGHS